MVKSRKRAVRSCFLRVPSVAGGLCAGAPAGERKAGPDQALPRYLMRLPVSDELTPHHGELEVTAALINPREQVLVQMKQKTRDLAFLPACTGEKNHGAGHRSIRQIVQVGGGCIQAVADSDEPFR